MASFAVIVKTKKTDTWAANELRFKSRPDATNYATDLQRRWRDVVEFEVIPNDDEPNCVFPVPSDRYAVVR